MGNKQTGDGSKAWDHGYPIFRFPPFHAFHCFYNLFSTSISYFRNIPRSRSASDPTEHNRWTQGGPQQNPRFPHFRPGSCTCQSLFHRLCLLFLPSYSPSSFRSSLHLSARTTLVVGTALGQALSGPVDHCHVGKLGSGFSQSQGRDTCLRGSVSKMNFPIRRLSGGCRPL